jgi:DNA-binding XRE family transcriptional regulator
VPEPQQRVVISHSSCVDSSWSSSDDCRVPTPDPRIVFGKQVRKLRLARQLSQEKLAELADLHRNYVGGVERGERNVSLINIVKLAHGLDVRPTKLIETIR